LTEKREFFLGLPFSICMRNQRQGTVNNKYFIRCRHDPIMGYRELIPEYRILADKPGINSRFGLFNIKGTLSLR
jgi:hypothetical protein